MDWQTFADRARVGKSSARRVYLCGENCFFHTKSFNEVPWHNASRAISQWALSLKEGGIAKIFKDLSNPICFTLNLRAVGSTPTRPTKFLNHF